MIYVECSWRNEPDKFFPRVQYNEISLKVIFFVKRSIHENLRLDFVPGCTNGILTHSGLRICVWKGSLRLFCPRYSRLKSDDDRRPKIQTVRKSKDGFNFGFFASSALNQRCEKKAGSISKLVESGWVTCLLLLSSLASAAAPAAFLGGERILPYRHFDH